MTHDHAREAELLNHGAERPTTRRLLFVLALTAAYMISEVIGGWVSGSLALLADAGHMLSDVAALALSLLAMWIARRPATARRTYGYYRMEILVALVNGVTLIGIALLTTKEAVHRLAAPPAVQGKLVMLIAAGGLLVNLGSLWLLSGDRTKSLNIHGAWLHVFSDALGSVAALAAGALVWASGWTAADPILSILISLLIAWSAWGLLIETVNILLEGAPSRLDVDVVRDSMISVPGVEAIHDLHVWTISGGLEALSAHVIIHKDRSSQEVLDQITVNLKERFGLTHTTIQIETASCSHQPASI